MYAKYEVRKPWEWGHMSGATCFIQPNCSVRKCNITDRCCMVVCAVVRIYISSSFVHSIVQWLRSGMHASPLMVLSHNKQSCKLYHTWYTSVSHALQLRYLFVSVCVDGSCISKLLLNITCQCLQSSHTLTCKINYSGVQLPNSPSVCLSFS